MVYTLVDCNSFFVSCERVFRPDLWDKPVLVLSNNDGCVIARSSEVKELGIPMGAPYFKVKEIIQKHNIHVFSSNFVLYGDLSHRVMQTLKRFSHKMEIYSVDEAFLQFEETLDFNVLGKEICRTVFKETGIPVSVGFGQTKTLAKAAGEFAKKHPHGTFNCDDYGLDLVLSRLPVGDVWGIGRNYSQTLKGYGITTAQAFRKTSAAFVRKKMGVVGLRTWEELNGTPCFTCQSTPVPPKSILSSRSFGHKLTALDELKSALANNVLTAAKKLRRHHLSTSTMVVFLYESIYKSVQVSLPAATYASDILLAHALQGLEKIYRPGVRHSKSGVLFLDLVPSNQAQTSLLIQPEFFKTLDRSHRLSKTIDQLNHKWNKSMVVPGVYLEYRDKWGMNQKRKSPRYTTCVNELAIVHCR